jgi:hypothetical protein
MGGGRRCTKGALAARGGRTGKRRSRHQHAPRRRGAHRRHEVGGHPSPTPHFPPCLRRVPSQTRLPHHEPRTLKNGRTRRGLVHPPPQGESGAPPAPPGATLASCDYLRAPQRGAWRDVHCILPRLRVLNCAPVCERVRVPHADIHVCRCSRPAELHFSESYPHACADAPLPGIEGDMRDT